MAKIISFFTAMFLVLQSPFLFAFGRDGRALGKATLVLEASSYAVGTEAITGTLHNGTLHSIARRLVHPLDKWDGNQWRSVDPILYFTPADPDWLRPLQSGPIGFDLTNYDPPLEAGRYQFRIGGAYAEFTLVGLTGEVTLTTEFETYPVGTREITATLFNGSTGMFSYTVGYRIEKFIDGQWVTVGPNIGFIALMVNLWPGCGETLTCELSCNEPMEAGRYRIGVGSATGEFTLV